MASPQQILKELSRTVTLRPGLSEAEIAQFEEELPAPLPHEIKELLSYSAGFDVVSEQVLKSRRIGETVPVLFTGNGSVGLPKVVPCPVALLGDGCGNFWVVDVSANGVWGAILFVCHDPPVIAFQAADLVQFLAQVLNPSDSKDTLEFVRGPATTRIWKEDPWLVPAQDARTTPDSVLSRFAEQLPSNFDVADLRSRVVGIGFSWGRAGPSTDIRRNGADLLFGIEQKPTGFLKRLLSRSSSSR